MVSKGVPVFVHYYHYLIRIKTRYGRSGQAWHGFRLQRRIFVTLLATALFSTTMPPGYVTNAGSTNTKLIVSARVLTGTSLKIIHQTKKIIITGEDKRKGYIDIEDASHIEIKSNNPAGYMLAFQGLAWPFSDIHVRGLAKEIQIGPGNTFIYQPYNRGAISVELDCRLFLAEDAKPGVYNWPLFISSRPV